MYKWMYEHWYVSILWMYIVNYLFVTVAEVVTAVPGASALTLMLLLS